MLAAFLAFMGGAWAIAPADVEWVATRYLIDTAEAYESFIDRYEESRHVEKAVWRKAEIKDKPEDYLEYLEKYPEAEAARKNDWAIPQLEKKVANQLKSSSDTTSIQLFKKVFPKSEQLEELKANLGLSSTNGVEEREVEEKMVKQGEKRVDEAVAKNEKKKNTKQILDEAAGVSLKEEPAAIPKKDQIGVENEFSGFVTPELKKGDSDEEASKAEDTDNLESEPVSKGDPIELTDENKIFGGSYGKLGDPEGNIYRTMPLNGLTWMADNLNLEVDGSLCYKKDPENCAKYGRLYTWEAANNACQSLGDGWRLPTDQEWRDMAKLFGGVDDDAADKGKAAYKAMIEGGNSGFSVRLGGWRNSYGKFDDLGDGGVYWSATENHSGSAWYYNFLRGSGELYRLYYLKDLGFSCRCVKSVSPDGKD